MLCLFFSLILCQSGPPGQIIQARSLIMADSSLAEAGWKFSQTFGGRRGQPMRARLAQLRATPLRSKSSIIEY